MPSLRRFMQLPRAFHKRSRFLEPRTHTVPLLDGVIFLSPQGNPAVARIPAFEDVNFSEFLPTEFPHNPLRAWTELGGIRRKPHQHGQFP